MILVFIMDREAGGSGLSPDPAPCQWRGFQYLEPIGAQINDTHLYKYI